MRSPGWVAYAPTMQLVAADLVCPSCLGYVHLFLGCCPACGTERASRLEAATATGPLGAAALLEDDATRRAAHMLVLRYTLRSSSTSSMADLLAAFGVVAGSLAYRAAVAADGSTPALPAGPTTLDGAALVLVEGSLEVRAGRAGRSIATIPLDGILAATPIARGVPAPGAWAGVTLDGRRLLPERLVPAGDLLVTFSSGGAAGQLVLANRRGLLAQTARPDHYAALARWIGILGAAAAEARWVEIGAAAYAGELAGRRPPVVRAASGAGAAAMAAPAAAAAAPAASAPNAMPPIGSSATGDRGPDAGPIAAAEVPPVQGVRAALEELESLRAAGLVTAEEFETKRREILARL